MLDAATQDRRRNERAKLRIFRGIAKWRRWRHAPQLTATAVIRLVPSFFEEMTRCRREKHCRRRPNNPNGPSKCRKYRVYLPLLRDRDYYSTADGSGSCHAPAPSYFERMTRCRCEKLHCNPNCRSKFRNLELFTFIRSQLMLWRRLRG